MDSHEQLDYHKSGLEYTFVEEPEQRVIFNSPLISGFITYDRNRRLFTIKGQARGTQRIEYWSANPLLRLQSTSGSGLPYPNATVAYQATTNKGVVPVINGQFTIDLPHPAQYYVHQGKTLLKPHVHLKIKRQEGRQDRLVTLILGDTLPHRSLTHLPDYPNRSYGR